MDPSGDMTPPQQPANSPASPDAKPDLVMSYLSVCVIQEKDGRKSPLHCKQTVHGCIRLQTDLSFKAVRLCWNSLVKDSSCLFFFFYSPKLSSGLLVPFKKSPSRVF